MSFQVVVLSCFFLCSKWCTAFDVCGLESYPKFNADTVSGIQGYELAIRKFSVTEEAIGFFLQPLDPLELKEISFIVDGQQIKLENVQIFGLLQSKLNVSFLNTAEVINFNVFTHNLLLEAESSVTTSYETDTIKADKTPVKINLSNVITNDNTKRVIRQRCDGKRYMNIHLLTDVVVKNGTINSIEGLEQVDSENCNRSLLQAVGSICTKTIYNNFDRFTSIVDVDRFAYYNENEVLYPE